MKIFFGFAKVIFCFNFEISKVQKIPYFSVLGPELSPLISHGEVSRPCLAWTICDPLGDVQIVSSYWVYNECIRGTVVFFSLAI